MPFEAGAACVVWGRRQIPTESHFDETDLETTWDAIATFGIKLAADNALQVELLVRDWPSETLVQRLWLKVLEITAAST